MLRDQNPVLGKLQLSVGKEQAETPLMKALERIRELEAEVVKLTDDLFKF